MTQRATVPMALALIITTLGFATLIFVQEANSPPLVYGAYYVGMMIAVYFGVRLWLPHSDALLLPIVTLLTGLGLIMIYRLTYQVPGVENRATTQAVWILVGSGALLLTIVFFRNYQKLFAYKYLLALAGVGLMALPFTPLGYEVNDARLWVQAGPATFQPSEFARIGRIAYVILGGVLFLVGSLVTLRLFSHVHSRVMSWLDPWSDPQGSGFQITQSLFNIADGGLTGTGLGKGFSQTIPEVETDFVFSTAASELGLLGATALLLAFLVFVYRGIKIALLAEDDASKLLAFGLTAMFAMQTLIIVGGVTKAIPLTGITLPFVSYGGSSVVRNFVLPGLLLLVSERAGRREVEGLAYADGRAP